MKIDSAALPFVAIAAVPAAVSAFIAPPAIAIVLLILPIAIALFFRDPGRQASVDPLVVLSPADGKVTYAGVARPAEAPPGEWRQVTIFLSLLDVHINRTPVAGRVVRVDYLPGSFRAAFRPDAHANERTEIRIDHRGMMVVARQVVGVLARRVVCRIAAGDRLEAGQRIGLMKFGSRMDVFVPLSATLTIRAGDRTRGGETVIARLGAEGA